MSLSAAEAAVRAYFKTAWVNGASPRTVIAWPDDPLEPPVDAAWVRFNMLIFDGFQASIGAPGNNRQRRVGQVVIQIFQRAGKGSTEARSLADLAVAAFVNQTVGGVAFENVHPRIIGNDGAGFYQINVIAPFKYDDLA